MNKKLHFLLFCLAVIIIIYLSKDKLIEPYGSSSGLMSSILEHFGILENFDNQIVIHPDNASFDSKETTFSVLTYDSDLGSGVTQVSTCSDDSSWRNGDKTCRDYSLDGANCEDIGSDGRLAFDACKVACDNCNTYTEVKRRLPSPMEDTDDPSYVQFEGSMGNGDIGGPDYREIIGKLDDLSGKIDSIDISNYMDEDDTVDATCVAKDTTSEADVRACAAVTDLSTAAACQEVVSGSPPRQSCNYNPASSPDDRTVDDGGGNIKTCETEQTGQGEDVCGEGYTLRDNLDGIILSPGYVYKSSCCKQTCANFTCPGGNNNTDYNEAEITNYNMKQKQHMCCMTSEQDDNDDNDDNDDSDSTSTENNICIKPSDNDIIGYNLPPSDSITTKSEDTNIDCSDGYGFKKDKNGDDIKAEAIACKESGEKYTLKGCVKTGFCSGNDDYKNDVYCNNFIGSKFFYTDKEFKKDEKGQEIIPQGQGFDDCCEYNLLGRSILIIIIIFYNIYKTWTEWGDADSGKMLLLRIGGVAFSALWIFMDTIPVLAYYIRRFFNIENKKSDIDLWKYIFILILTFIYIIVYNIYDGSLSFG